MGVFLLLTAAFGGLGTAPPSRSEVAVGEAYNNDQVSITIEQLLVAESVDRGSIANPDDKVVVVVATAVNRWDRPQTTAQAVVRNVSVSEQSTDTTTTDPATTNPATTNPATTNPETTIPETSIATAEGLRGEAPAAADRVLDAADAPSVIRLDDLGYANELQPGVPVRLAVIWTVDSDFARRLAAADQLLVTLYAQELIVSEYVSTKDGWNFPTPAATVVVTPTARGSIALSALDSVPSRDADERTLDSGSTPAIGSVQG